MKPPGSYKLRRRSSDRDPLIDPFAGSLGRCRRIVDSLRCQILEGGPDQLLHIRQVFENPREIYRVEIREPALHYQRTTLLDRDALEDLLESEDVRERFIEQGAR